MKYRFPIIFLVLILFTNCRSLPKKLSQASIMKVTYEVKDDSLRIQLSNPLNCPLRYSVSSSDIVIQEILATGFPVILSSVSDTVVTFRTDKSKEEISMKFSATLGNQNARIFVDQINLPFRKDQEYEVIQGYNGSYSHNSEYSKYAIDFNLKIGDTICAAADGYVVGVIEDYIEGGKSKKWRDYANYITIFHPEMNLYTQYVHLMNKGSLVEVGDYVKSEQAIGFSGKTGQTDMEHLHFNVLKPNEIGMESVKIEFKEGYKGSEMKRGDLVKK